MPRLSDVRTTLERSLLRAVTALPPRAQQVLAGRPVVIDGQRLATDVQLVLRLQRLARIPGAHEGPVEVGREVLRRSVAVTSGRLPVGSVESLTAAGLPARLYVPTRPSDSVLVYFHGGGFFCGDLDTHDGFCRRLAEGSGVRVLSVQYRLGPEHAFPAAHDDARAAYAWACATLDATSIGVGGDSAGGNLAAYVASVAATEGWPCDVQLLLYPMTEPRRQTRSLSLFGEGFYLTRGFMAVAEERYPGGDDDPRLDALAAPLPAGLAPAVVVTAGFDPLRDEGEAYADRLRAAGVPVTAERFPALIHGFLHLDAVGTSSVVAIERVAELLAAAYRPR